VSEHMPIYSLSSPPPPQPLATNPHLTHHDAPTPHSRAHGPASETFPNGRDPGKRRAHPALSYNSSSLEHSPCDLQSGNTSEPGEFLAVSHLQKHDGDQTLHRMHHLPCQMANNWPSCSKHTRRTSASRGTSWVVWFPCPNCQGCRWPQWSHPSREASGMAPLQIQHPTTQRTTGELGPTHIAGARTGQGHGTNWAHLTATWGRRGHARMVRGIGAQS
jgi:hypothetical protein